MKLLPVGNKLLLLPKPKEDHKTESGLHIANLTLMEGEVVEVSNYLKDVYKVGDTVLVPVNCGHEQFYNGKPHLFINGQETPNGDVWCIVTNE